MIPTLRSMSARKMSPRKNSGKASWEPKLATGTTADLRARGAYPWACWMACPASWAATPTAATEADPGAESLKVLVRGS